MMYLRLKWLCSVVGKDMRENAIWQDVIQGTELTVAPEPSFLDGNLR